MPLQGETLPDFASRPSGKTRPVRATFGPRSLFRAQLVVWAKAATAQPWASDPGNGERKQISRGTTWVYCFGAGAAVWRVVRWMLDEAYADRPKVMILQPEFGV
jgi:hypothetical protein